MNKISATDISNLLDREAGATISIYIPTHQHANPPAMQEDQTRFKNNLRAAREQWRDYGGDEREVQGAFKQLESYLDTTDFWQHTSKTLAVFVVNGDVEIYHLPIECEETVYVGEKIDATPLLAVDSLNQPYYLLALAMHTPRMYKGDIYGLEQVNIDLPESPEKALNIDELHANSKTVRSHQTGGAGSPHGEGDSAEAGQEERMKYFRIIEQAITESNDYDDTLPLLLAGTGSEVGDFRTTTKLHNVLQDNYIAGNHTETSAPELDTLARPLIFTQCIKPSWREAAEKFDDMTGADKASSDHDEVVQAASDGRVDTLMIACLDSTRDSISDTSNEPTFMLRRPDDDTREIIMTATQHTVNNGGTVLMMRHDDMLPDGMTMAALLRY